MCKVGAGRGKRSFDCRESVHVCSNDRLNRVTPQRPSTLPVNAANSTRDRILGAAEKLFAERGFDGASLRQLTSAAGVNLAAVNYHFGSKEKLVEEVFRRRLDALNTARLAALAELGSTHPATLEEVLAAYIRPALELSHDGNGALFIRVLARAFAEHDDTLRRFLSENYGHVMVQKINDELTGRMTLMTKTMIGKAISDDIPQLFSEAIYARREGSDFFWSTATSGVDTKTRYLPLSEKIKPDFALIMNEWKRRSLME